MSKINWSERLKQLSQIGQTPKIKNKAIRNKKEFSKSEKAAIRKNFVALKPVLTAAPTDFKALNIDRLLRPQINQLKNTGYLVVGKKAYIPLQGYKDARLQKKGFGNDAQLLLIRKTEGANGRKKKETEFLGSAIQKMDWKERLLKEYEAGKFKEGEYVAIKFFNGGVFARQIMTSLDAVYNYFEDNPTFDDSDERRLLNNIHLVKIEVPNLQSLNANMQTEKEKNKARYLRAKKRKTYNKGNAK